jgi:hypothetical protein
MEQQPERTRDRALMLIGFAGAFPPRSELVGLDVEDLASLPPMACCSRCGTPRPNQEGAGRDVAIPFGTQAATCPVSALRAWLDAAAITTGPVFRQMRRHSRLTTVRLSDHAVAVVGEAVSGRRGPRSAAKQLSRCT